MYVTVLDFSQVFCRFLQQRDFEAIDLQMISRRSLKSFSFRKETCLFIHKLGSYERPLKSVNIIFFFFYFKACVRYFYQIFIYSPSDSPSKTMKKCFLFHLKSSFCSRDYQIFVFPSSPIFLLVGHCFRG